jgi:hypothetical protein
MLNQRSACIPHEMKRHPTVITGAILKAGVLIGFVTILGWIGLTAPEVAADRIASGATSHSEQTGR